VLADRDVALLAASIFASTAGDWIAVLAIVTEVGSMSESGFAISAVFIALWLPVALLAGHAGVLVDRVETTRLLAATASAQIVLALALAVVQPMWGIYALLALLGSGFAVSQACEFALVPAVAGPERIPDVNGVVESARYAGFILGPSLGGVLAAWLGRSGALVVDAATFGLVVLVALTLRARRPPREPADAAKPRARDGLLLLFQGRELRLAMIVAFVSLLFMSASIPADFLYVRDELERGGAAFGLVLTAWTLGMIVGALALGKRIPPAALLTAAFVATAVQGAGKTITPLVPVVAWMTVWYLVGGLGHGVKNVALRTLLHRSVPADAHGRASASFNGLRNTAEIGALLAGAALVDAVGAPATLVVAGGVSALAGLAGLTVRRGRPPGRRKARAGAGTIGSL
jgi:MFS family permease